MKIWIHPYELEPLDFLNSQSTRSGRPGVLLKVEFPDIGFGYADLHSWRELKDKKLFDVMRLLTSEEMKSSLERSLSYAKQDALRREADESLFVEPSHVHNHFLVTSLLDLDPLLLILHESHGFDRFKIKVGRSLKKETPMLKKVCDTISNSSKLRLDFNESLDKKTFHKWIKANDSWLSQKLEFIEDPFPYEPSAWRYMKTHYDLSLAMDMAFDPFEISEPAFDFLVVKPAVQDSVALIDKYLHTDVQFVFTHYMDHPLGQMTAYWLATEAKERLGERMSACGLLPAKVYAEDEFSSQVSSDGPKINPPSGCGLGFDQQLSDLRWIRLTGY